MKCDDLRIKISYYLDNELPASEQKELLEHLDSCDTCSKLLSDLQQADNLVTAATSNVRLQKDMTLEIQRLLPNKAKRNTSRTLIIAAAIMLVVLTPLGLGLFQKQEPLRLVIRGNVEVTGNVIKTHKGQEGVVQLADSSCITLKENTEIWVERSSSVIHMLTGSAFFEIQNQPQFRVTTPVAQVRVNGTKFGLTLDGGADMKVAMLTLFVISGMVELVNAKGSYSFLEGEKVFATSNESPSKINVEDRRALELERALHWLARHQNEDGSWSIVGCIKNCGKHGRSGKCEPTEGDDEYDVGATGLVLLAFLGAGHTPESKYEKNKINYGNLVDKGLKYLLKIQDHSGRIGKESDHLMYNHILASLAITEAYLATKDTRLHESVDKALNYLKKAQNFSGDGERLGWRYIPRCGDNDSSVTGWASMLLRSASQAGFKVEVDVIVGIYKWYWEATDGETGVVGYDRRWEPKYPLGAVIRGLNGKDKFDILPAVTAMKLVAYLPFRTETMQELSEKEIEQVKKLVKELGDDDPLSREKARTELKKFGPRVVEHLKPFVNDKDPERAESVRSVIQAVKVSVKFQKDEFSARSVAKLLEFLPAWDEKSREVDFYYWLLGTLAVHGMFKTETPERQKWDKAMMKALIDSARQNGEKDGCKEGSWEPVDRWSCKGGRLAMTAMGALILELYQGMRVLGIYTRDKEDIVKLIKNLAHNDAKVRDETAKKLVSIGDVVRPYLEKELKETNNEEVRKACSQILETLRKNQEQREKLLRDKKFIRDGNCSTGGKCFEETGHTDDIKSCARCSKEGAAHSCCRVCKDCAKELGICITCRKKIAK